MVDPRFIYSHKPIKILFYVTFDFYYNDDRLTFVDDHANFTVLLQGKVYFLEVVFNPKRQSAHELTPLYRFQQAARGPCGTCLTQWAISQMVSRDMAPMVLYLLLALMWFQFMVSHICIREF